MKDVPPKGKEKRQGQQTQKKNQNEKGNSVTAEVEKPPTTEQVEKPPTTEEEQTKTAEELPPPDPLTNPFWLMEKALEHKLRNLKRREGRLLQLKADGESGALELIDSQKEALSKLDEVKMQITFVEEMQKLNGQQQRLYKKANRTRERALKAQERAKTETSCNSVPPQTQTDQQLKSPPQSEKKEKPPNHPPVVVPAVKSVSMSNGGVEQQQSNAGNKTGPGDTKKGHDDSNKENCPWEAADDGGWD